MFEKEAFWIKETLGSLGTLEGKTVLDLGSSTKEYRCKEQPFIDSLVFRPLREKGARIFYHDLQKFEGIDIVCDLAAAGEEEIRKIGQFDIVLCTSVLEHVPDVKATVEKVKMLAKPGGIIILSVPNSFPYHPAPIDNGFRPSDSELAEFFPEKQYKKIASGIIEDSIFREGFLQKRLNWLRKALGLEQRIKPFGLVNGKVAMLAVRKLQTF